MDRVTSPSSEANICVKPSLAAASHTSFIPAALQRMRPPRNNRNSKQENTNFIFSIAQKKLPRWRSTGAGHSSQPTPWGAPISASPVEKHDSSSLRRESKRNSLLLLAEPRRACSAQHSHSGILFSSAHTGMLREHSSHLGCESGCSSKRLGLCLFRTQFNPCPWCLYSCQC